MYDEYNALGRQLNKLKLGVYLEFGCGSGGFLKYLLGRNTSADSVVAVDIHAPAVEHAREELAGRDVRFIVEEKLPLDFKAAHFSTITLSNTLHHLRDKASVFTELKRLVRSDGQIIITEMVSNDLSEAEKTYCLFHSLRAEVDQLNGTYHDTTYTSDAIEGLVVKAGLKIEKKLFIQNEKQVVHDKLEIARMETIIDDLVQGAVAKPEFGALKDKGDKIKKMLQVSGIKRPRQLYLKTTLK